MATIAEKQLAQARPAGTSAVSIYTPAASVTAIIKQIFIVNTSGAAATFRVFVDDDGTTYDETTALYWDVSIDDNETMVLPFSTAGDAPLSGFIHMDDSSGNLAVQHSVGSALTFTVFGAEITV